MTPYNPESPPVSMDVHALEVALRDFPGPADERVEALTPHGSHRFTVNAVEWDDDRRAIVLRLHPVETGV